MSEVEESLQEFAYGRWLDEGSIKRYTYLHYFWCSSYINVLLFKVLIKIYL